MLSLNYSVFKNCTFLDITEKLLIPYNTSARLENHKNREIFRTYNDKLLFFYTLKCLARKMKLQNAGKCKFDFYSSAK